MNSYINKNLVIISAVFCAIAFSASPSIAQSYLGDLPRGNIEDQQREEETTSVPPIFSSEMLSTSEGEKLDIIYNNLLSSLWNYSITDFRHQKKLFNLVRNDRFKTTRYAKEFTGDLEDALANLNSNYKSMMNDISSAEEQFKFIREGIRSIDYENLDPLWAEKISSFKSRAETYFKMQHGFLKTYRSLVSFILDQGGSYYYKQETQKVYFYRFEGYKFFGKTIDRLNKINFKQRELLRSEPPANVDLDTLK